MEDWMAGADGCVKGWMLEWMEEFTEGAGGCGSEWVLSDMDEWIDGCRWMQEWMDASVGGRVD